MKSIYTIELVMDFPVIFLKVSIVPILITIKIFVILSKVRFRFFQISISSFSRTALGWNKEKITIIGHSYGAIPGMIVKTLISFDRITGFSL